MLPHFFVFLWTQVILHPFALHCTWDEKYWLLPTGLFKKAILVAQKNTARTGKWDHTELQSFDTARGSTLQESSCRMVDNHSQPCIQNKIPIQKAKNNAELKSK